GVHRRHGLPATDADARRHRPRGGCVGSGGGPGGWWGSSPPPPPGGGSVPRVASSEAATATPAGVVRLRSITCGADCSGRPCTLRDMRVAQRALDEYPPVRLWTELSVLAHLTGWPMPVPRTALLSLLQMMPSRLRDCALSH